jgi:hypothetical protein
MQSRIKRYTVPEWKKVMQMKMAVPDIRVKEFQQFENKLYSERK